MKIAIIAGSNRKNATSTHLSAYLARLIERNGFQATLFDLHEKPLPFFSPDEYGTTHPQVVALKQTVLDADAVVLATPEYHGSISGVLKNALDFLSQDHFSGKPVLSVSSAGGAVGVSSLQQLQAIVRNLHGINAPEWLSIGGAQRRWFETATPDEYEVGHEIGDRIHRVLDHFLALTAQIRKPKA
ncbi:NADPH-dependent FMN reductase [Paenibacillus aurantiacus]|uniref:NADPH-dependent FMN reductase n=1 Tax=Paenibacillus aurantiacus TaxID=1936118 RepID=A0ABV5KNP3_9BACL